MIWDLEFKRAKTLYVREQIRQEYDTIRSKLEIVRTNIEAEKEPGKLKDTNADEFNRLGDDEVRLNAECEKKIAQMSGLDTEIHGAKSTAENPEGHQGINETLGALRELRLVLKEYIATL